MLANTLSLGLSRPPLWRVLFAVTGVIGVLTTLLFPVCVESPKWLVAHGRTDQAHSALARLRKNADITLELQDMIADAARQATQAEKAPKANVLDVLMGRTPDNLRHQLVVVSTVMLFQQMSGINAVIFYSTQIFNRTTHDDPSQIPTTAQILSLVISIVAAISVFAWHAPVRALRPPHSDAAVASAPWLSFSLLMVVGSYYWHQRPGHHHGVFVSPSFFNFGVGPLPWATASEMTASVRHDGHGGYRRRCQLCLYFCHRRVLPAHAGGARRLYILFLHGLQYPGLCLLLLLFARNQGL
ncbi:hypothetical protein DL89DRAFT_317499 [Linderina pennispora]|uniref:Major facilitator superfamily (MFS) profile domain-containing protein n=1 Tax=Linderina pennispora TaxID=61395 RepID=A0A1Y1W6D2_9FUNG|nr:uncharacterized protein DL89DRAFT_317499 [Linderina pennispora]ORX69071.1 hypothetical protein DL89DRAFT_317499 [Linderina pennispora]